MNESQKLIALSERCLNEMAVAYRTGSYAFVVYTDHVPPHFHLEQNGRTICKVIIPQKAPTSISDIQIMKTDLRVPITNKLKKMIFSGLSSHKKGVSVYSLISLMWDGMNEVSSTDSYDYSAIGDYIV